MNPAPLPPPQPAAPARNTRFFVHLALVTLAAFLIFAAGAPAEPEFNDEAAYLSQSYFFTLLRQASFQDPRWLEYPALDLPPLPKYLIGLALDLSGTPHPGREAAVAWYQNPNVRFTTPEQLRVARIPSLILGAVGVAALFALGYQIAGAPLGWTSVLLLIANPLYRLHARRAMSDAPAEALTLLALAIGLHAWRLTLANSTPRPRLSALLAWIAAGAFAGLATLAKLSGGLACLVLLAWGCLGLFLQLRSRNSVRAILLGTTLSACAALGTFVMLNPFVYAHAPRTSRLNPELARLNQLNPVDRLREIIAHRAGVSINARSQFPAYALHGPADTLAAIAVQGAGRFGPLGPPRHDSKTEYPRYSLDRDWGSILWIPLVLAGACAAVRLGRRQLARNDPPTGWAALLHAGIALGVVAAFLPLAWDRYYLPIQGPFALLGAVPLAALLRAVRPQLARIGRPTLGVFLLTWIASGLWWHARDWNTSSRLMLLYALGDRAQVSIDGLENQTGDRARFQGHYYSDKPPGLAFAGLPAYSLARAVARVGPHPLHIPAIPYHAPDLWITWCTAGLATAIAAALITRIALGWNTPPSLAILLGLAYALATPAAVYASLAYGHQITSCCVLAALALIDPSSRSPRAPGLRAGLAGLLAGLAVLTDFQALPLAGLLAALILALVLTRRWTAPALLAFALGAAVPAAALLAYNHACFGSFLDFGYAHHDVPRFSQVHSRANPLGLRPPRWELLPELLAKPYRGLIPYAPATLLALPGWCAFALKKRWGWLAMTFLGSLLVLLVNLSYPEWTGGWSTGPRFLLPALPLLFVAAAAALAAWPRGLGTVLLVLALAGFVHTFLFQGVGGRIPESLGPVPLDQPLASAVLPLWRGDPLPGWATSGRFTRTLPSSLRHNLALALSGQSTSTQAEAWELALIAASLAAASLGLIRSSSQRDYQ
jgi:hypothetical protein